MVNSLVSIIIPVYNGANTIAETLESVLRQTYNNWECIIVDDGSTDNTEAIVLSYKKKHNRFKCYKRPKKKPKGPSAARNYGLKKANGDYIIFLDSDDLLSISCLENRIDFAKSNPNFDFWVFKMNIFEIVPELKGQLFNTLPNIEDELVFYKDAFYRGRFPFQTSCPLWKKQKLLDLNGFDESMTMLEDPDLHLRALKLGLVPKTANEIDVDCFYRFSNDDERKEKSKNYSKISARTNFYFLKKHWKQENDSVLYNYKRIFNLYVFTKPSFELLLKMIILGRKNKILKLKQALLAFLICAYLIVGINKVKGIGYAKLRTLFNNF